VAANPVDSPLHDLTEREFDALVAAAAWYAKRHEGMISAVADDVSASATQQRERYLELHSALWKLGVRLRLPDGLALRS
jgi:hypothetical protein